MPDRDHDWEAVAAAVREQRTTIDQAGQLPGDLVESLRAAGAFHLVTPTEYGGLGLAPTAAFDVVRTLARASGSTGWVVAQASAAGLLIGLADPAAAEVMLKGRAILAGVLAPKGAVKMAADGGVLVGRWPLASGCAHADVMGLGAVVSEGGSLRRGADGSVDLHIALVTRDQLTIDPTWDSLGLRGTSSHHVQADRVRLPHERLLRMAGRPQRPEPWFQAPIWLVFPAVIAAVAIGIADDALDSFRSSSDGPDPRGLPPSDLADLGESQARLETCTAGLRWLLDSLGAAAINDERRVRLRSAVVASVDAARHAADVAFRSAGAAATYTGSPVEVALRDVHTLAQHRLLSTRNYAQIGEFHFAGGQLPAGY